MSENEATQLCATAISASIDAHRAFPDIDISRHVRTKHIELGRSLRGRRPIYLDLNFWIELRNASLNPQPSRYSALLTSLRNAVSSGLVFCPISDSCFMEVFKQSDLISRDNTARLIDELSLGVTLTTVDLRIGTEIAYLMHSACTSDPLIPLDELVWAKLSNALGSVSPQTNGPDIDTALAVEKALFDHMWTVSLAEIGRQIGNAKSGRKADHHEQLAHSMTQAIKDHTHEFNSFNQVYMNELIGVVDLYTPVAADILFDMAPPGLGPKPAADSAEYKDAQERCLRLLVAAMKTDRGKASLRTFHINTSLHAALRWNKGQKFKANDFFDFQHAAAAVGYCDAFFTERSLCSAVTRSDLALDKLYKCTVVATPEEALKYVLAIA